MIVVISGPGGAGKGTIVRELVRIMPELWLSRSWTTREIRPDEDPDSYVFVDRAAFDQNVEDGGFLEWVDFLDYRQGSPHPPREIGSRPALFEIDVHGARAISDQAPDALLIFIDTPDEQTQRERLAQRGDPEDYAARRVAKAAEERRIAGELGAKFVINRELAAAVEEVAREIRSHPAYSQSSDAS